MKQHLAPNVSTRTSLSIEDISLLNKAMGNESRLLAAVEEIVARHNTRTRVPNAMTEDDFEVKYKGLVEAALEEGNTIDTLASHTRDVIKSALAGVTLADVQYDWPQVVSADLQAFVLDAITSDWWIEELLEAGA